MHRKACWVGLQVASTKGEHNVLRRLLAGPTWTASTAAGHAIMHSDSCPFFRGAPETEPHILWDRALWDLACQAWMPWVLQEAFPSVGVASGLSGVLKGHGPATTRLGG